MKKKSVNLSVKERTNMDTNSNTDLYEPLLSFNRFNTAFIRQLADNSRQVTLQPGETLFHRGDEAGSVYILLEGLLTVVIQSQEKKYNVLNEIKQGEPVGVIPVLLGGMHTATVSAKEPCTLAEIESPVFHDLVNRFPDDRIAVPVGAYQTR
jgi:CRP-like cAMP-binding protein